MFSLVRSLSLRYLIQKWDRSVLVALSIAFGVAALVSTRLLNQCVDAAAMDTTIPADVADLYVHNGESGVDWEVADDLRAARIPGVRRVESFVYMRAILPELGTQSTVVFGIDVTQHGDVDLHATEQWRFSFQLVNNPRAFSGRPIAMCRKLYEERKRAGRSDTDPVEVRYTNATEKFDLIAIIDVAKDSPIAPYADKLVIAEVGDAAKLLRRPGKGAGDRVTRIDLFLEPTADKEAVEERAQSVVGARAAVRTAEANRKSTSEVIGGIKMILTLCSVFAYIVVLFLIYNAMAVTVVERRHDIGVMRSLGATRGQIARMFAVEAIILGAVGAIPGIPLGIAFANTLIDVFISAELSSAFLNEGDSFRADLSAQTGTLAVGAGVIIGLLAALIPSWQAASDEPADAVRRAPSGKGGVLRMIHRIACAGLELTGISIFLARHSLPSRSGSLVGMSLILLGLLLAMPIFVGLLARMVQPFCRWLFGIEARLASDNLIRSPGRTGVVIGALAAGVTLMVVIAGVRKSQEEPINDWLSEVIRADAYLFRGNMVSANSSMTPMEAKLRDDLRALPGVERVVGLRFYRPEYRGTFILMVAIDAKDYKQAIRARVPDGLPTLDLMEKLPDGNYTIVSENFAYKWNVKVGDVVTVPGPRGSVDLTVIGIGRDYSWAQGTIFVDRAKFGELFDDHVVDAYHVFFRPEADHDATYKNVQQYADGEQLLVQNRASVQLYLAGVLDRIFLIAYLLQIIVAVVSLLGVVMALMISVLQRRRELGLLRSVGATRTQVMKTVLAEATLMGILGTLLGVAIGLPLEWFLLRVFFIEETGLVYEVLVPWKQALGIGAISIATATIAGLLPAIRAVRLRITEAIAYE